MCLLRKSWTGPPWIYFYPSRVSYRFRRSVWRVHIAAEVVVGLVALLHVYFLLLEMVLWKEPIGLKTFGNTPEKAEETSVLAANQGLYNGFLVAGLVWSILATDPVGYRAGLFFLSCVIVAGAFGAVTVSKRILFVQAAPAALAMILLVASH